MIECNSATPVNNETGSGDANKANEISGVPCLQGVSGEDEPIMVSPLGEENPEEEESVEEEEPIETEVI